MTKESERLEKRKTCKHNFIHDENYLGHNWLVCLKCGLKKDCMCH